MIVIEKVIIEESFNWYAFIIASISFLFVFIPAFKNVKIQRLKNDEKSIFWGTEETTVLILSFLFSSCVFLVVK
jgi:hypothetical protein